MFCCTGWRACLAKIDLSSAQKEALLGEEFGCRMAGIKLCAASRKTKVHRNLLAKARLSDLRE